MNLRKAIWEVQLFMAKYAGWYKYTGLRGYHPHRWPLGYVRYKDGKRSVSMPLGNALDYAQMFGGTVEAAKVMVRGEKAGER